MNSVEIGEHLSKSTTRRTVVRTGVRLAYAAPIVAASFALTASGALALCPGGFTEVVTKDGPQCCTCASTVISYELSVIDGIAWCVRNNTRKLAKCQGVSQVSPG